MLIFQNDIDTFRHLIKQANLGIFDVDFFVLLCPSTTPNSFFERITVSLLMADSLSVSLVMVLLELSSCELFTSLGLISFTSSVEYVGGWFLRNKHITVQSSTLEPGYLLFQAFTAWCTNNLAAVDRLFEVVIILITSLSVNTSHICNK